MTTQRSVRKWLMRLAAAGPGLMALVGMAATPEPSSVNGTVVKFVVGESLTLKKDGGGEETFYLPPKSPEGRWPQGGIGRADVSMRGNHIQPGMKIIVRWVAANAGRKEIAELLTTGTVVGTVVGNLSVSGRALAVKVEGLERPMRFFCHYVAPLPGSGSSWIPDPKDSALIATPLAGAQVRVDYELRGTLLVKGLAILKQGAGELPRPQPPVARPPITNHPATPPDPPELRGVGVPPPPPSAPLPEEAD